MYELNFKSWACIILTGLFLVVGGVGSCMYIRPKYNVWSQEMAGKAEFAKAEQNRKIKIDIGADLITMCSMLRIPVCMHNVPEDDIYRPAAWNAFGMDKEGQDYRACATYGPLYK